MVALGVTLRRRGLGPHKGQEHDYASRPLWSAWLEDLGAFAQEAREGLLRSRQAPGNPQASHQERAPVASPHCQRDDTGMHKARCSRGGKHGILGVWAVSRGLNLILFLKRFGFQIGAWVEERRLNVKHTFSHFGALP